MGLLIGLFLSPLTGILACAFCACSPGPREEKDDCLDETMKSFKYSGGIMRSIFS